MKKLQATKFQKFQSLLLSNILDILVGPWKRRSFGLISLLIGFYFGSNLTVYFLEEFGQRPIIVLIMMIFIESLVRLRTRVRNLPFPLHWIFLDNFRIGIIYAVVLEAFKLGS